MVLSNNIKAVKNTDLWSKCDKYLKNIATGQYLFIDKDHNYQPSVQTAKSKDVVIFDYKYAPKYIIILIKTEICAPSKGICALTGQSFPSEIKSTLFIAPLLKKNDSHLAYQEFTVISQH